MSHVFLNIKIKSPRLRKRLPNTVKHCLYVCLDLAVAVCPDLVRVAELGRGRARGAGICLTAVLGRSLLGSASFLPEEGFNLDNISLLFFSVAASRSLLEKGLDLPDRQKLVLSLSMLSAPCSAAGRGVTRCPAPDRARVDQCWVNTGGVESIVGAMARSIVLSN